MKYIITTLGCKVNQYETQAMERLLRERGHTPAAPGQLADAVLINTCAVTAESARKSRQTIRRLRDENPGAAIAVCGCYAQLDPDEAETLGAAVVFGTNDHTQTVLALERAVAAGMGRRVIDRPFERRTFEALPAGAVGGRTRAMLKIQDGCVNFCSYCIIPYTRGRLRSLPPDEAAAESARLSAEGYRELVLTGIEIASYGVDLPGKPHLADAVKAVAAASGEMRIRLGSLEPSFLTEEVCARLAAEEKLCRHFHLSLQSGCDRTLKAMNRKYDTAAFFAVTERLRRFFPGCALTTDLIVGFPGETEADHAETLAFIRRCAFADMHIFPYSRRPGTPADKLPGQCDRAVKARRAHEAQAVCDEMRRAFFAQSVGQTLPVLFETEKSGVCTGHSDTYLPVGAPGTALRGLVKNVKITGADGEKLVGAVL